MVEEHLSAQLPVFTSKTITDPEALKRQYRRIRETGLGYDHEEYDLEVDAVSAPIFNHQGKPVAAVVIIAPSYRMDSGAGSKTVALLKETAAEISARLFARHAKV